VHGVQKKTKTHDTLSVQIVRRLRASRHLRACAQLAGRIGLRGPQVKLQTKLRAKGIYWYHTPDAPSEVKAVATLASDKLAMRRYVKSLGLRLPEIYQDVGDVDAINFANLPDRVVVKPHNGWDGDAVILIDGDRELFSGTAVPRATLPEFCRKTFASAKYADRPRIIVEELVRDYEPQFAIPRDFKVHVAGGKAWVIQVSDRNGPKSQWRHSFYTSDWTRFTDPFQTNNRPGPLMPPPPFLPQLLSEAELMAKDLGAFLRLDFYLDPQGPVFGEITWNPFNGVGFTPLGARYLCDLMDNYPDKIRPDLAGIPALSGS
jgi:hypothetical protein